MVREHNNRLIIELSYKKWNNISIEERNYLRNIHNVHDGNGYNNFCQKYKPAKNCPRFKYNKGVRPRRLSFL